MNVMVISDKDSQREAEILTNAMDGAECAVVAARKRDGAWYLATLRGSALDVMRAARELEYEGIRAMIREETDMEDPEDE